LFTAYWACLYYHRERCCKHFKKFAAQSTTTTSSVGKFKSVIFQSCIFQPFTFVRQFLVPHFPALHVGPSFFSPAFSSPAFSVPPIIGHIKNRLHRAVSLRQHGFLVQPTKQQINLLIGYFPSGLADLGTWILGDSGSWLYRTGIVIISSKSVLICSIFYAREVNNGKITTS